MKTILKKSSASIALMLLFLVLFSSCRTEEFIATSENDTVLEANSVLANLLKRMSLNDGSNDNILDLANCFNIKLPVTVVANGTTVVINNEDDIDTIEAIFNEFDTDTDTLEINYPITVIFSDYDEMTVNSQSELNALSITCPGENEDDEDIECLDFLYPITISVFNTITEQSATVTIQNDKELFDFIDDLDDNDVASINFPVTLVLSDDSQQTANTQDDLENIIDTVKDDCDEDDDYDFEDDDCVDCTPAQVLDILTMCSDWTVDKLERNNMDLEDLYNGFTFNFLSDGTIAVQDGVTNHSGTWSTSGSGVTLRIIITIASLPDFDGNWFVHEIEDVPGEKKVDLRVGERRLRFESDCN